MALRNRADFTSVYGLFGVIRLLSPDDVIRMIPHFDFDAPQLPVAPGVCRVVGEDVAAFDAGKNPAIDSRRLSGLFQVFRPSARKLGHSGKRQLLAEQSFGASLKVIFKRGSLRAPPHARSGLK